VSAGQLPVRPVTPGPVTAGKTRPAGGLGVTLGVLLVALGLAAGLVAGLDWFAASLPGWQASAGPDFAHDTAADAAENAACNWTAVTYDQARCGLYLQEYGAREAYRLPRAEGGVCDLATRYDCAARYGLAQHDEDVPVWRPWELHNGRARIAVNTAGAILLALTAAGAVWVLGAPRPSSVAEPSELTSMIRHGVVAGHSDAGSETSPDPAGSGRDGLVVTPARKEIRDVP
jgi:hypothetical protein